MKEVDNKMIKKKIENFFDDAFSIPLDSLLEIPNVQFIGNKLLHIDGCIGVKKYDKTEIIIKCKKHILKIYGESLTMIIFSQGRITIRGIINSFYFEEQQ